MKIATWVLEFREIDIDRDAGVCIQFRADSFAESFGSSERFFAEAGPDCRLYLERLRANNRELPGSCAHAWLDRRIVGQVEVRRDRQDHSQAHVLLYYLVPDVRGSGLGDQLDAYVLGLLRRSAFVGAWLRVSPSNARAIAYYRKHGWTARGPDPLYPNVSLMERAIIDAGS